MLITQRQPIYVGKNCFFFFFCYSFCRSKGKSVMVVYTLLLLEPLYPLPLSFWFFLWGFHDPFFLKKRIPFGASITYSCILLCHSALAHWLVSNQLGTKALPLNLQLVFLWIVASDYSIYLHHWIRNEYLSIFLNSLY